MIVIVGGFAIVFFYSGTFFNWDRVKGLYLAFKAWTEMALLATATKRRGITGWGSDDASTSKSNGPTFSVTSCLCSLD